MADKKSPEHDRRTRAYKQAALDRGELALEPHVEAFAECIYDCEYRETLDQRYWVPSQEIAEVVYAKFPGLTPLSREEVGHAIKAAHPDCVKTKRTPPGHGKQVAGYKGITGPGGCCTK